MREQDSSLEAMNVKVRSIDYESMRFEIDIYLSFLNSIDKPSRIPNEQLVFPSNRPNKSESREKLAKLNEFNKLNRRGERLDISCPVTLTDQFPIERRRLEIAVLSLDSPNWFKMDLNRLATSKIYPIVFRLRKWDVRFEDWFLRFYGG